MKLILASQSPRRRELLSLLGLPFDIFVPQADESMDPGEKPEQQVALVSRRKAEATPRTMEQVVIAADTIVVCDGKIMGKPQNREQAIEMLSRLSGHTHQVMTGLTVLYKDQCRTCTEVTQVTFRSLSPREIARYVDSGEPMDKAGAYGIQGGAALFAEGLSGDYYNVVGLPVCRLVTVLQELVPELMEELT